MDMEVDMVADGVNDMEVYKIADEVAGMVEDKNNFTDVTLVS